MIFILRLHVPVQWQNVVTYQLQCGGQVARKFVPVVCGGGVLAVVDQHAADERVCLERLRAEVPGS